MTALNSRNNMAGGQFLKWLGVVVIGIAAGGCRNEPSQYQTSTVTRGTLVQAVTASGTLSPVTNVQVGSQISGIILKLNADFNSPVKAGQVVAQLDPATYKANVSSAEANLASAKANLEFAQSNARRDEELHKSKLLASFTYEQTLASLHQAEADVGGILVGQDVEFSVDAFMYETFRGKVIQVRNSPIVLNNVVTYDTIIEVSNPEMKLKPGMTANVSIVLQRREDVLRVPNAALRFRPPEVVAAAARTNPAPQAIAQAPPNLGGERGPGAGGAGGRRRGGGGGAGFGGGRGGGAGFGSGGGRARGERASNRTVYLMTKAEGEKSGVAPLKPVQVRVGISDGILTEVLEGLEGGETVVVGTTAPTSTTSQTTVRPTNPLGGGGRGGGFRGF